MPVLVLLILLPSAGSAQDFSFAGFGDARLVDSSGDRSSFQGGLGKLQADRDGGPDFETRSEFAQLIGAASVGLLPELRGFAELRWDPNLRTELDLLDAYLRWRPVSTGNWRWSVKAGAFFPPISLENDGIGWTSPWTLTPSAIDSWVGDELRILGGEAALEWRDGIDDIQLAGALYGWNDPAGDQIAHRGWVFDDSPAGLFGDYRETELGAGRAHATSPAFDTEFAEIDDRPGWYADLSWSRIGLGRVQLLRYDNAVDTAARGAAGLPWHTRFWSLGTSTEFGDFTLLAQGIVGQTTVAPAPAAATTIDFQSAYLLLGWERGQWRFAARVDQFGTVSHHDGPALDLSEHGWSPTISTVWKPLDWLRLTAETLVVDSWRVERLQDGLSPRAVEAQLQFGARVFF
jgi:hypothetical protein